MTACENMIVRKDCLESVDWAGLLNVTYRYYPVFVPHWIALHGMILPRSEPQGEHEVSFEQKHQRL